MSTAETKTWTIERRGAAVVLMTWSDDPSHGPIEVRQFDSVEVARAAAERDAGRALAWREPLAVEARHGVVTAADA